MSWSFAAFAIACVALIVAIWDARRGPVEAIVYPSAPPVTQAAPAERDTALEARIAELEARLQRMHRLVARSAVQPLATVANAPATPVAQPIPPQQVEWRSPRAGVDIEVSETGALRVINTDPDLAGQLLKVEGEGPDGQPMFTTILVPPPEA
jgi:hypothetical protein